MPRHAATTVQSSTQLIAGAVLSQIELPQRRSRRRFARSAARGPGLPCGLRSASAFCRESLCLTHEAEGTIAAAKQHNTEDPRCATAPDVLNSYGPFWLGRSPPVPGETGRGRKL